MPTNLSRVLRESGPTFGLCSLVLKTLLACVRDMVSADKRNRSSAVITVESTARRSQGGSSSVSLPPLSPKQ